MKKTIALILPQHIQTGLKKIFKYIAPSLIYNEEKKRREWELAVEWCSGRAVTVPEAIGRITSLGLCKSFYDVHADIYTEAMKRAEECPISMGGPGNLELIFKLTEYIKATRVIETGVAYGWSSLAFLLSLKNRDGSLLVSTDMPYSHKNNDHYVGVVVPESLRAWWQLLRGPDSTTLPRAVKMFDQIDICHYDSDKSYGGRMWAYGILWNALRSGGVFISDDIGDNLAFRDFSKSINIHPLVVEKHEPHVHGKYVGILTKP